MFSESLRRTTLIWSAESTVLSDDFLNLIRKEKIDALRIVPRPDQENQVIEFVDTFKAQIDDDGVLAKTPILADIHNYPRGIIKGIDENVEVGFGDDVTFVKDGSGLEGNFSVVSSEWDDLFAVDHSVYVGFGSVVLKAKSVETNKVHLNVVQGGVINPEAEIHVPFTRKSVTLDSISSSAWHLVENSKLDYLILPSIDDPVELEKICHRVHKDSSSPWVILRVGTKKVYENMDALLPLVRGVMVSRIELSMEMDPAQVPMVTKEIIQNCNRHAKLALVASEMLGSMRFNATPTRAEVSDIANAVFDGADGVVLSEALADGDYLQRGAMLATRALDDAESTADEYPLNWIKNLPPVRNEIEAVTYAAYRAAHRNQAKAIVCLTKVGNTAFHLASFGARIPIIALSPSEEVVRRLKLVKGVEGIYLKELPDMDAVLPLIDSLLSKLSWFDDGDKYVFVSVTLSSLSLEGSNLFTIQTLGA